MDQYINDPYKYLEKMQNDKSIVIFKQEVKGLTLYNLYLNLKLLALSEEKLYLKNPFFVANIRRGNSLIQDKQTLTFCSRGLIKLYDLERKFIEKEQGHPIILSKYQEEVCHNILNPIKEEFKNNKIIHLYKLPKENGKQCQISYTHDHWILSTKKSTILFNKPEDLSIYSQRCSRAKQFAINWIEIIKEQNLEHLKEFLKDHTLIGEYCGNPEQQDILRYPQALLVFFAIVKNNSPEICLPVERARQICLQFNLQFVKVDQITLNSYESALKQLGYWSQQIGEGSIKIEGEGAVVYAITENQKIISVCKLKTVEFQIYRKLREMLKTLIKKIKYNQNAQLSVELGSFFKEIQIIIKHYQPPQPILNYLNIAKLSFDEVLNIGVKSEQIKYQFINFLEEKQNILKYQLNQQEVKLILSKKNVRVIIVTLPFFLKDEQLHNFKDKLDIQSIESQLTIKNMAQRAISVIFLTFPKLPQNVTNEQELEEYLQNSELQNQDPLNVIFLFLGLNQQALEKAIANLQSNEFQEKNPISKSLGIQVASAKPQSQQVILQKWLEKAQIYLKDCLKNFPTRTFQLDNLDYQQLDAIIKQFELTEQVAIDCEDAGLKQNKETDAQKKIVIIYPLMIPGSGKSTLAQYLKQNYKDFPFYDISADEITLQFQKKQQGENHDSMEDKFQKAFPFLKEIFQQEFHKKINEIINCEDKAVLFVDRNCVPHTLQSMIDFVKAMQYELAIKNGGHSVQIINLGLIFPTQEASIPDTPFTIDYAITILNRLISRENHILLADDAKIKAQLCINSLTMFVGFKAKDFYFKKLHLDKVVPMTYPQDRFPLDKQELQLAQDLIAKCVKISHLGQGQGQELAELIEHLQVFREKHKIPQSNINQECKENNDRLAAVIQEFLSS